MFHRQRLFAWCTLRLQPFLFFLVWLATAQPSKPDFWKSVPAECRVLASNLTRSMQPEQTGTRHTHNVAHNGRPQSQNANVSKRHRKSQIHDWLVPVSGSTSSLRDHLSITLLPSAYNSTAPSARRIRPSIRTRLPRISSRQRRPDKQAAPSLTSTASRRTQRYYRRRFLENLRDLRAN